MRFTFMRIAAIGSLLFGILVAPAGTRVQTPDHQPRAQHARLVSLAGEYDAHTKYYWTPGKPPDESKGVSVLKAVLGGRFLMQEDFDATRSAPPSGIRLYGYNVGAGQYEAVWSYTRSTGLLTMKGRSEDGGRTIRFTGQWENEPGQFEPLNATLRLLGGNRFAIELGGENADAPRVETVFTRRGVPR